MIKKSIMRKAKIMVLISLLMLLVTMVPLQQNASPVFLQNHELEYIKSSNITNHVFLINQHGYAARTEIVITNQQLSPEHSVTSLIETLVIKGKYENRIPTGFHPIIPEDTMVRSVKIDKNVAKINFSKELLEISKKDEEQMIEAIIYTATSVEGIDYIIIYVEGEILNELPHSKRKLPPRLNRSFGINKVFNLNSTRNIVSFNIYYTSQIGDKEYFVPVTKYVNSTKDVMTLVMNELRSSKVWLPYLTNNVPNNANIINYHKGDEVLNLVFNEYILSNGQSRIEDNIMNAISLSMFDNFGISEVNMQVNNHSKATPVFRVRQN